MKFCPECELDFDDTLEVCPDDGTRLVALTGRPDELVGRSVDGRYTIETKIGEGGMGAVYLATQEAVGRKVALKVLRRDLADDTAAVKRFFHEAKVVSKLRHPNTITLYDFGQSDDKLLYIAMEYMTGEALDVALDQRELTLVQVLEIGDQVCQSLAEAHEQDIVHRDLKPENIFIDRVGSRNIVKVLDFGIAKIQGLKSNLTLTGMVFGTPAYMSPEQAQGFSLDARTDLYSLGVLLFELLCGRLPFPGQTAMKMAMSHILEPVPDIDQLSGFQPVPVRLRDLIYSLMSKEPKDRPRTADDTRNVLLKVLRQLEEAPDSVVRVSSGSGPIPATTGNSQRVALRERDPTPALDGPSATGPQRRAEVYSTGDMAVLEKPSVGSERPNAIPAPLRRSKVGLLVAVLTGAVLSAFAALVIPQLLGNEDNPAVAVSDSPENIESAVEAPAQPEASQIELDELSSAAEQLAELDRRQRQIVSAGLRNISDYIGEALADAEEVGNPTILDPQDVVLLFNYEPDSARVQSVETDEVVCTSSPCSIRVPYGMTEIAYRISQRRYRSETVRLVPDQDQRFEESLRERRRRTEPDDEGSGHNTSDTASVADETGDPEDGQTGADDDGPRGLMSPVTIPGQ